MKYKIVLNRLNDILRYIQFDNEDNLMNQLSNIYERIWDILFNETSDKLFSKAFWSNPFLSMSLIKKFKQITHNKKIINNLTNFSSVYELLKRLLVNFNFWNNKNIKIIYILNDNNDLVDPEDIKINIK